MGWEENNIISYVLGHLPGQASSMQSTEEKDLTAPFHEQEAFGSICAALRWRHVRVRLPICLKKLLHSRYMLANLIYLFYSIGILIINCQSTANDTATTLDQPVNNSPLVNHYYILLGVLHLISAFLYWWAWRDRSWLDIVMIPEYLNHLAAVLYLWSACWYSKQDTLGGYYTLAVHRIEITAATIELFASFGWIYSWHMTYVRSFGRGFTFDDPDTTAFLTTTTSSIIYFVYNLQINLFPEQYGTNLLYQYGDTLYFIGACYYVVAALRDENFFWFLPLAGQYGVAPGRVQVETKVLPQYGKTPVLLTDVCQRRVNQDFHYRNDLNVLTMANPLAT